MLLTNIHPLALAFFLRLLTPQNRPDQWSGKYMAELRAGVLKFFAGNGVVECKERRCVIL
jgi:hypothetical protein